MSDDSRIGRARVRARGAKALIASGAVLVFGAAFVGAKLHAPGHAKGKPKSLGAPKSFERAVKQSIAHGGVIEPPVQPPAVVTSTS